MSFIFRLIFLLEYFCFVSKPLFSTSFLCRRSRCLFRSLFDIFLSQNLQPTFDAWTSVKWRFNARRPWNVFSQSGHSWTWIFGNKTIMSMITWKIIMPQKLKKIVNKPQKLFNISETLNKFAQKNTDRRFSTIAHLCLNVQLAKHFYVSISLNSTKFKL